MLLKINVDLRMLQQEGGQGSPRRLRTMRK
jgi:hypothetical protein